MARCLAEHPQVSGFSDTGVVEDEGQHLQSVYPPARTQGGPGRFVLSGQAHLTEASPLATPANAARLLEQWRPHWDVARPVLLEKSPPNLVMGRFLQELFPGARFVMVVRHPVVVALSTKKWTRRTPLWRLLDHWFTAHDLLVEDAPHLRHLHVVKYEDFVRRPDAALGGIGSFLGLDGPVPTGGVQPHRSSSYERTWQGMRTHRNPAARAYAAWLVHRYEERARLYGYSLLDLERADPFPVPGAKAPVAGERALPPSR
jgi:hypothetical protein